MWTFAALLNATAFLLAFRAGLTPVDLPACLIIPSVLLVLSLSLRRYARGQERAADLVEVLAFISLVKIPFVVLSYAGTSIALPLWDQALLRADQALGLDWAAVMHWVDRRPWVALALYSAYKTIWLQLLAFVYLGAFFGAPRDVHTLLRAVVMALGAAIVVGSVCPALGILSVVPVEHFERLRFTGGSDPIAVAQALRSGHEHLIDLWQPQGLIVFPSFHAAMAVILIAASLRKRAMTAVFVPLNLLMLASAYTEGGHYMCDIIAGAAIGAVAWQIAKVQPRRFAALQILARETAARWTPRAASATSRA